MRLNRKQFLRAAAVGLAASATGITAAPAPAPLIIDTHTHFYDPSRQEGVPWPAKNDKLLYRTALPKDYKALPKPSPVAGTVVVEASAWVEDNQWILDLAARETFIVGFVGNLSVGSKRFQEDLRRFSANKLFRGIRVNGGTLAEKVGDKVFLNDLRELANRDLSLDVVGGPEILEATARLAGEIPGLRIVMDHMAGAKIDGKTPAAAWSEGMRKAGGRQNVFCKISGLVEGTGRNDGKAPEDFDYYLPWLEVAWKAFGQNRLIYGSNWTVCEIFAPCSLVQQLATQFAQSRGPAAMKAILAGNARAAYKWVQREDSQKPAA